MDKEQNEVALDHGAREQPPRIRGAIRTQIETSVDAVVGGHEFSIFVIVLNPFEVPISLRRMSMNVPTEFDDLNAAGRQREIKQRQARIAHLQDLADEAEGKRLSKRSKVSVRAGGFLRSAATFSLPSRLIRAAESTTRTRPGTQTERRERSG